MLMKALQVVCNRCFVLFFVVVVVVVVVVVFLFLYILDFSISRISPRNRNQLILAKDC